MTTLLASALIVTADEQFGAALQKKLRDHGCHANIVGTDRAAIEACGQSVPELILIDRDRFLPHLTSIIRNFRALPLLAAVPLVTVADPQRLYAEEACILDLEAGFDGCLCNLTFRQIVAHARAILRSFRNGRAPRQVLEAEGIIMDLARHEVRVGAALVDLTPREFAILRVFLEQPRIVLSRQDLLDRVWGQDYALEEHVLDVHIHALRRKIEQDASKPARLVTVRGVGYKLQAAQNRTEPDIQRSSRPPLARNARRVPVDL